MRTLFRIKVDDETLSHHRYNKTEIKREKKIEINDLQGRQPFT